MPGADVWPRTNHSIANTAVTWATSAWNSATYGSKHLPTVTQSYKEDVHSFIVFHSATNAPSLHGLHAYDTNVNLLIQAKIRLHPRSLATSLRQLLLNITQPLLSVYNGTMHRLVRAVIHTLNHKRHHLRSLATYRWQCRHQLHPQSDDCRIHQTLEQQSTAIIKFMQKPTEYSPHM